MKKDIYQEVTNSIIDALEKISLDDYQAPFAQLTAQQLPINPITKNRYRGINTLILWFLQQEHDYSSNEWGTFKQWKDKGAHVKKGEKSSRIIFYKQVEKKDSTDQDNDPEFYNMLKSYCVFNADQVDAYEPVTGLEDGDFGTVEAIENIEHFIEATGAVIEPDQNQACYSPLLDTIKMPKKELFFDNGQSATENYYAVLLHELTHWTGGKSRLDRMQQDMATSKESYAFEELIAELGSAFLCVQLGIKQHGRDDHALYLKSWLQALRNDRKYIFKASSQAQKAVDCLNKLAEV
jgi:antirestriction protein ArdC